MGLGILEKSVKSGRVAHAYLFCTTDEAQALSTALSLARALNCEAPEPQDGGCGTCRSCQEIKAGRHADVRVLAPDGSSIKIGQIRRLEAEIALKPRQGRYKVWVIKRAQDMTDQAANCLLKTLEEPPGDAVLILIAPSRHLLLPTIVSRCQVLVSPGSQDLSVSQDALSLARAMTSPDFGHLFAISESMDAKGEDRVGEALWGLLGFLRDCLVWRETGRTDLLTFPQSEALVKEYAGHFDRRALLEALRSAAEARESLRGNANVRLALDVMLLEGGRALESGKTEF
ncbi:MAG: hypothetical protein HYY08_04390 [Firmicutes bacterium]|nr:hypothetical protein [Bacillota bacterium]